MLVSDFFIFFQITFLNKTEFEKVIFQLLKYEVAGCDGRKRLAVSHYEFNIQKFIFYWIEINFKSYLYVYNIKNMTVVALRQILHSDVWLDFF